jgi:hypothetical protein
MEDLRGMMDAVAPKPGKRGRTRSENQLTTPKERLTHTLEGMCFQYQVSVKLPSDASEGALLKALAELVDEHLSDGPVLDNLCMSAGEQAMALLEEYDLLDFDDGHGRRDVGHRNVERSRIQTETLPEIAAEFTACRTIALQVQSAHQLRSPGASCPVRSTYSVYPPP